MNRDENQTSASKPTLNPEKWFGQLVAAVILGEGVWGFVASLTSNVLLPLFARAMDGGPQSPSYLGKGDLDIPALFNSFLALCLAGIVSALLYGWSRRKPAPVQVKTARVIQQVSQPAAGPPSITVPPEPVSAPTTTAGTPTPAPPGLALQQSKPTPPSVVAPSQPAKPHAPKEVYYNLVGEPINPTEDDRSR
jgi:hypothetical protein